MLKNIFVFFFLFSPLVFKVLPFGEDLEMASTCFSQDFEVAPAKLIFDCEPGQIQSKIMTVRNYSSTKQQFLLTVGDGKSDSLGTIKKTITNTSCKDWLSTNPSIFDLNPNETKEITINMQVPPNMGSTRWAIIYVSAVEEQNALSADKQVTRTGLTVRPRIAVRVIQSPKSNTNYKATITNLLEITQPKDSVRTFQATISNTGDKVIDAKIYVDLSNLQTAKETKLHPVYETVYPGSVQNVKLIFPKNIEPGKYSFAAILDYGKNSTLEAIQMNIEVK